MLSLIFDLAWKLISYNSFQIPLAVFHLLTSGSAG